LGAAVPVGSAARKDPREGARAKLTQVSFDHRLRTRIARNARSGDTRGRGARGIDEGEESGARRLEGKPQLAAKTRRAAPKRAPLGHHNLLFWKGK
jgi:hypothetical protein